MREITQMIKRSSSGNLIAKNCNYYYEILEQILHERLDFSQDGTILATSSDHDEQILYGIYEKKTKIAIQLAAYSNYYLQNIKLGKLLLKYKDLQFENQLKNYIFSSKQNYKINYVFYLSQYSISISYF